jgi:hypothetical protein
MTGAQPGNISLKITTFSHICSHPCFNLFRHLLWLANELLGSNERISRLSRRFVGHERRQAVTTSYGSFGTSTVGFNLGYGGQKWGNFSSASGLDTGRFLDPPEFTVIHAKGNEENIFDRIDYQLSKADSSRSNCRSRW